MLNRVKDHQAFVRRISRSILAMNVALILTSMLAFYAVWRIGELSRITIAGHARDRFLVQELRLELERGVSLDRAFLLTGDSALIPRYQLAEKAFFAHAEALELGIKSPEGMDLLKAAIVAKQRQSELVEQAMRLRMASGTPANIMRLFEDEVQPATQALRELLAELVAHKTALLNDAGRTAMSVAHTAWWVLLVLALANFLFSIGIRWTTRSTLNALNRYGMDLAQAVRVRDEFLAIASHELRTPLSVVKLQTQLLKRRLSAGDLANGGTAYLETFTAQVDRAVNSLSTLITRMLDMANISRGRLLLQKERVDLKELTQEVIAQLEPIFSEVGSTIHLQPGDSAVGHWDKARLHQLIMNLLMNVTRHAPGCPANAEVTIANGKARLVVEDSGPGIAREDQVRIFERFERAHMVTDGSGLGLGLAVSKEIAQAHGGQLWVESETGKGARFVLELPVIEEG